MEALKASLARRQARGRAEVEGVVKLLAGTSGYAFKEWKGSFYPNDLHDDAMLGHYASAVSHGRDQQHLLSAAEGERAHDWAAQVPERFTFAIKASQRITHHAGSSPNALDSLDFLLKNTRRLGPARPDALPAAAEPEAGHSDRLRAISRRCCQPTGSSRSSSGTRAGSTTRCTTRCAQKTSRCASSSSRTSRRPSWRRRSWGYLRLHRFDYDDAALARTGRRRSRRNRGATPTSSSSTTRGKAAATRRGRVPQGVLGPA